MAMGSSTAGGGVASQPNVTPMIDVMLVLLIMFIITIPVATHSIDIDLPVPNPPTDTPPPVNPIKNKVSITPDNKILWNGNQINGEMLAGNLQESLTFAVEPELQFQPDPQAGYDLSARVLNIIKASKVTKFGFVGNEQYSEFNK